MDLDRASPQKAQIDERAMKGNGFFRPALTCRADRPAHPCLRLPALLSPNCSCGSARLPGRLRPQSRPSKNPQSPPEPCLGAGCQGSRRLPRGASMKLPSQESRPRPTDHRPTALCTPELFDILPPDSRFPDCASRCLLPFPPTPSTKSKQPAGGWGPVPKVIF